MSCATSLVVLPGGGSRPTVPPTELTRTALDILTGDGQSLPFHVQDITAGSETELQAAVAGRREAVDLPLLIESSAYYAHLVRRARAGDTPEQLVTSLEGFLQHNSAGIWENSWVRLPERSLHPRTRELFDRDLLADKRDPAQGRRGDADRFFLEQNGECWLRLPVSYLVKLALHDFAERRPGLPPALRATAHRLTGHYLNDNTSPETFSFHVTPLRRQDATGRALARETAKRFLFSHLLVEYANHQFELTEHGQQARIWFAPHPPLRQRELNDLISDSFYRELFMSPCLSGWDRGEEKHRYMHLCHQTLSRSQLNAMAKLKEAGVILNNLVVLPRLSNTSLANNGVHVSLGSRRLTGLLADPTSGFDAAHEKALGDLAIKFQEHFMALFVGSYSGAPCRLGFTDFHPERALGFLPHQLDYTHLRMLWRRWRRKAKIHVLGHDLTPFGPPWLDGPLARIFGLKGDWVPDLRLLDYPVGLLSTEDSPGWNGQLGNQERLRRDLAELGVFDPSMSLYSFFKLREYGQMGFSGFEGRSYSLFEDLEEDMGGAVGLQALVTALAFRRMAQGRLRHEDIPDSPAVESERRQIFFASAIGIPTFYVRRDTPNKLLAELVGRVRQVRASRRYPGYLRVPLANFRRALLEVLEQEAADLVEAMGLGDTLRDLRGRLERPERYSASGKLNRAICDRLGVRSPLAVPAETYNRAAEDYYRDDLRRQHLTAAYRRLERDLHQLELEALRGDDELRQGLRALLRERSLADVLDELRPLLRHERLPPEALTTLLGLTLLSIHHDGRRAAAILEAPVAAPESTDAPIRLAP